MTAHLPAAHHKLFQAVLAMIIQRIKDVLSLAPKLDHLMYLAQGIQVFHSSTQEVIFGEILASVSKTSLSRDQAMLRIY